MSDLDERVPNFHRAQQRWPDAPTLSAAYAALGASYSGNAHGLVEHAKSFIESVCLTIMGEYGEPMPCSDPNTTELVVAAFRALGLLNSRGASKLDKVLSGFNKLVDGIAEARNANGAVAHGKDGFLDTVDAATSRAYLQNADVVLGALLGAVEGTQPDLMLTREACDNFPHHNKRIDESVVVDAVAEEDSDGLITIVVSVLPVGADEPIELRVEPSRFLYAVDRGAYIEVLKAAEVSAQEVSATKSISESFAEQSPDLAKATPPVPVGPTAHYEGPLGSLRAALEAFLTAEGVDSGAVLEDGSSLTDSLLAVFEETAAGVDWKQRPVLGSRLGILVSRLLVRFGTDSESARDVAEKAVSWLRAQGPDQVVRGAEE